MSRSHSVPAGPRPHPLEALSLIRSYQSLPEPFYQRVAPRRVPTPYLISFNPDAATLLDLDPAEAGRPEFAEYFTGNRLLPGADPLALGYAGHQFGVYVPELGDGRAILVAEVENGRSEKWDVQLKGAGRTRFSRGGDGRAVLRSTIREYLCSEAMHGLGIPTTRALCITGTGERVEREMLEPGAVLTRLAPSHVRFGSFEQMAHIGRPDLVKGLADHVIAHHFGHLAGRQDRYAVFFAEVVERTARLIADWQSVGFAHGVMNTDNMSILGLTLDYGPFGFMDDYVPGFICNHSDVTGRYAFDRQPRVGLWNLVCLAESLLSLISETQARDALDRYHTIFARRFAKRMGVKLGLGEQRPEDGALVKALLELLEAHQVDYTTFFRDLGGYSIHSGAPERLAAHFPTPDVLEPWLARYRRRLMEEDSPDRARQAAMARVNPRVVLRNYLAEVAIRSAVTEGDFSEIDRLLAILHDPFSERAGTEAYGEPPPAWGRHLAVSCSS